MPLSIGTRFGPYEILSALGAGGMGEVYRARDTRLNRMVAVKVLAPALASDDFRARFAHEAKAISALNHPHICGLFDIGRDHDTDYLVLELIEGETLAARIERGALPLAQVLRFGIEIADALEAAHRRGIMHRDLKPANIMVTAIGHQAARFRPCEAHPRRCRAAALDARLPRHRRAPHKARSSGRCSTWHPNRYRARQPMRVPTSSRSAASCTRWRRGDGRSRRPRRRV